MTGPEHYKEGERLLSQASHVRSPDNHEPVHADGEPMPPAVHAALISRANAHFAAATAAANALSAALRLIGDDQQVTEWCKAIGATTSTPDSHRVAMARALVDEFDEGGLMTPATVERLREALDQTGGDRR